MLVGVTPVQDFLPGALAAILKKAPLTPEKIAFAWRSAVGAAVGVASVPGGGEAMPAVMAVGVGASGARACSRVEHDPVEHAATNSTIARAIAARSAGRAIISRWYDAAPAGRQPERV